MNKKKTDPYELESEYKIYKSVGNCVEYQTFADWKKHVDKKIKEDGFSDNKQNIEKYLNQKWDIWTEKKERISCIAIPMFVLIMTILITVGSFTYSYFQNFDNINNDINLVLKQQIQDSIFRIETTIDKETDEEIINILKKQKIDKEREYENADKIRLQDRVNNLGGTTNKVWLMYVVVAVVSTIYGVYFWNCHIDCSKRIRFYRDYKEVIISLQKS